MSQQTDQEQCQYEQLVTVEELSGNTVTTKLRLIEDNQMRLRHEFNNFRNDVMREIKSLQVSIKSLEEASNSLDESMTESFAYQQSIMDKMESKFLQNIDHLGKLILDVRRDIMEASKVHPSLFRPHDAGMGRHQLQKHTHTFEWEVGNLESLVKHQQKASSQSYLIGHVDFKILGGAVCTRDGRLCVRIYGDFTHMPINLSESKNGNFECSVYLVDKLGKRPNFLVGKVAGDFNNDKEWMIGDVPAADIQSKGYTARDGNVNLKFVIDVYA